MVTDTNAVELLSKVLADCRPAGSMPAYIEAKGIALDLAWHEYAGDAIAGVECKGSFVVFLRDAQADCANAVVMVETSPGDFAELYVPGVPIAGTWATIGKRTNTICLVADYASGASIHEATGFGVVVVFFEQNFLAVARALRKQYPDSTLLICLGFARPRDKSAILDVAYDAAAQVNAKVAVPKGARTFNDLHRTEGVSAVRKCLEAAERVPDTSFSPTNDVIVWPNRIHPASVIAHIAEWTGRYVRLGAPEIVAVTLWTLFTHFVNVVRVAPMLLLASPVKRCGKTTLLGVLTELVRAPVASTNITAAALFRLVESQQPTLLLDEAEQLHKSDDLTSVINAGHTRQTAFVLRAGKNREPEQFNTFCAKLIARIGMDINDSMLDRSIVIRMERKRHEDKTAKYAQGADAELTALRAQIEAVSMHYAHVLNRAHAQPPEVGDDRAEDNWEPLLHIAGLAGPTWLSAAAAAMRTLTAQHHSQEGNLELLLADIRAAFDAAGRRRLTTQALIDLLVADPERPWLTTSRGRPITPHDLGRMLRQVQISSRQTRMGPSNLRGYHLDDFMDAFSRYLPKATQ